MSIRRTHLALLWLLSFASVTSAAIITFSTSLSSNLGRIVYQWTPPAPASQILVNFTSTSNPANYITLGLSVDTQVANGTVSFDPRNPVSNSCTFCVVSRPAGALLSFPNDVYTSQMSFLNTAGTVSVSSTSSFSSNLFTMPATVASPVNGTNISGTVVFKITYPASVAARTANITCTDPNGAATGIFLVNPPANSPVTVSITTATIAVSSSVSFTKQTSLSSWVDGVHVCTFPWLSALRLPVYAVTAVAFRIKTSTTPPTLSSPTAGTTYSALNPIRLVYLLPEQPSAGSVNITLFSLSGIAQTFVQSDVWGSLQNVAFPGGVSDGTYTARFCYRDLLLNPPACINVGTFFVKQIPDCGDNCQTVTAQCHSSSAVGAVSSGQCVSLKFNC